MTPQIVFGVSVVMGFVMWGIVSARYIWPTLRTRPFVDALRPLLLFHAFRYIGLVFLVPGVVSPELPQEFARPAAYGDFATSTLALFAFITIRSRLGIALAWICNIVGSLDLLNAFYQGNHTVVGINPGLQGAAYFIPTVWVPLLLITHVLIFRILTRPPSCN